MCLGLCLGYMLVLRIELKPALKCLGFLCLGYMLVLRIICLGLGHVLVLRTLCSDFLLTSPSGLP